MAHSIPLGSLVEINYPDDMVYHGLRLFVVEHTSDFDGTPLYSMSFDLEAVTKRNEAGMGKESSSPFDQRISGVLYNMARGSICDGWAEESLIVIR